MEKTSVFKSHILAFPVACKIFACFCRDCYSLFYFFREAATAIYHRAQEIEGLYYLEFTSIDDEIFFVIMFIDHYYFSFLHSQLILILASL